MDGVEAVPEKIQLAWDNQPVTTLKYNLARQTALAQGGADKLMALETSSGMHTLGVHYTGGMPSRDHSIYVTAIPVQKKNTITVILLRPKILKKGLEIQHEVQEGPITERKEQWLELWFQNAIFYYHLGQFEEAAGLLGVCLESQEMLAKRAELLLWLGKTYLGLGLEDQAILTFQKVIREFSAMDRILSEAGYYLQKAQYLQGQYEAVTASYTRMARGAPPAFLPEMHYLAGQSFLHLKDYPKAIAALNQIPKNSKHYPYALYALGLAYLGLGDTYAAQQTFNKLIALDLPPDIREASHVARLIEKSLATLGFMFMEQNRYQEAISALGMVSTRSPFFDQALFGIGWSYMKMEEHVKAIVVFKDLTEMLPESSYAYEARVTMGYSYSKLKAYTKAVDNYRNSLEVSSRQINFLTQKMETVKLQGIDLSQAHKPLALESPEEADKIRGIVEKYQDLTRLSSKDWAQPMGNDLKVGLKDLGRRFSSVFQDLILQSLQRQRERLEELSIQASIGIAKNLVLEKTEFGGEELVFE
jgi:tetratricopeptide (TPR) repeat protein